MGGGAKTAADAARRGGTGSLLATLTGNLYLLLGTLLFGSCTLLTGWIRLPHGRRGFDFWARLWGRLLLVSSGVRVRRELAAPLDRRAAYVFLSNHQSLYDIPALLATLPRPARFMAKAELFRIPLFGWTLRIGGFIPVERGVGPGARRSFRAAVAEAERGGSLLIFPEETRSPDGRLLPFKRGGFLLAQQAGLPVVPVGIQGTRDVRPRGSLRIRPGRVLVRFGTPLPAPAGRRETGELAARVRAEIAALAGVEAPLEAAAEPGADGMVATT